MRQSLSSLLLLIFNTYFSVFSYSFFLRVMYLLLLLLPVVVLVFPLLLMPTSVGDLD